MEVAVVCSGRVTYTIGERSFEAGPGDVVVIPAGALHDFSNPGDTAVRLIAIHHAPVHAGTHLPAMGR
ncbi:MAG TPA: cupin domain-containing protein [Actinomycetota bacterium]|nr:cupin domain-containing protein [Actinomycetota bacterium]